MTVYSYCKIEIIIEQRKEYLYMVKFQIAAVRI